MPDIVHATSDTRRRTIAWSVPQRIMFRFAAAYLVLYALGPLISNSPARPFPGMRWYAERYDDVARVAASWTATNILHLSKPLSVVQTGSGDRTFDYVQLLCVFTLALTTMVIWSMVDRKRHDYDAAYYWLRVIVRYSLSMAMLFYGFAKIIKTQFGDIPLERLLASFGQASPSGLLWTFMGYSIAYNLFTGVVEAIGGALLLWQRTTPLGALMTFAAMSNVAMLDFSYDVAAKMFSLHLLLMAVFLLIPDAKRLAGVLVLNRPTPARNLVEPFTSLWARRFSLIAKTLIVITLIGNTPTPILRRYQQNHVAKPPLYGLYEVDSFQRDGHPVPPLLTESDRWRRVIVNRANVFMVYGMDDQVRSFRLVLNEAENVARLVGIFPRNMATVAMRYAVPEKNVLTLDGTFDGAALSVRLRRVGDESSFPLTTSSFHWIQELPLQR